MTTMWPSSASSAALQISQPDPIQLREPLLDLWHRNLPTASDHRCDWLYGTGRARTWLLGEEGTPPVGAAGLMNRRMYVGGQIVEGGGAIDLNVDQTQRSVGPALTLVRAVVNASDAEGRAVIYGMPNRSATAVMKRAGYQEIGEFSSWTKLLRYEQVLSRKLHLPLAARAVAPAINTVMNLVSPDWRTGMKAGIAAAYLERFDDRFDRLSARVASQIDVIGERSADFLNWRFTESLDLDYRIFTLINESTRELAGYVVWYFDEGAVSVSDLLAEDDASMSMLLAAFSRFVRQTRSSAIRFDCFGSSEFYGLLQKAGFIRRQNRHPVLCRWNGSHSVPENARWLLTMADSDTDV